MVYGFARWDEAGAEPNSQRTRPDRKEELMSIAWNKDIDAALVEARSSKRPLLVDFNATPM